MTLRPKKVEDDGHHDADEENDKLSRAMAATVRRIRLNVASHYTIRRDIETNYWCYYMR